MELTLRNENAHEIFDLPPAPEPWIRLHKVATGASLAAGALAYTLTHISGKTATSAAANTVRIGGSVLAHAGRLIAGDMVGFSIQTGARTTAYVVEQTGESATLIGSLLASSLAAVTVGSAFLLGNTIYDIYKSTFLSKPIPIHEQHMSLIESIEELEPEYVVYMLEDRKDSIPAEATAEATAEVTAEATADMEAVD